LRRGGTPIDPNFASPCLTSIKDTFVDIVCSCEISPATCIGTIGGSEKKAGTKPEIKLLRERRNGRSVIIDKSIAGIVGGIIDCQKIYGCICEAAVVWMRLKTRTVEERRIHITDIFLSEKLNVGIGVNDTGRGRHIYRDWQAIVDHLKVSRID
jgi:hypothetical protein